MRKKLEKIKNSIVNSIFIRIVLLSLICLFLIWLALEYWIFASPKSSYLSNAEWAGFLGNYTGAVVGGLISIYGIWWQITKEKREKKANLVKYINHIIDSNLNMAHIDKTLFSGEKHITYNMMSISLNRQNTYLTEFDDNYINQNIESILELENGIEILKLKESIKSYNIDFNYLSENLSCKKSVLENLKKHFHSSIYSDIIQFIFDVSDILYNYQKNRIKNPDVEKLEELVNSIKDKEYKPKPDEEQKKIIVNLNLFINKIKSNEYNIATIENQIVLNEAFIEYLVEPLKNSLYNKLYEGKILESQKNNVEQLVKFNMADKKMVGKGLTIKESMEKISESLS